MDAKIISIRTSEKASPLVIIEVSDEKEKHKYKISERTYREIGCPLSGEYIGEEALFIISSEDESRRALQKSLSLLSYADNNEKTLYLKLIRAGFSKEAAKGAVEECVRLGYIDEERQIERFILRASQELIGPYKISAKLLSKGYSSRQIFAFISKLEEEGKIDFAESKQRLMEEKLKGCSSPDEKRKLLHKYGYIK